jgi:hypothetical protein
MSGQWDQRKEDAKAGIYGGINLQVAYLNYKRASHALKITVDAWLSGGTLGQSIGFKPALLTKRSARILCVHAMVVA